MKNLVFIMVGFLIGNLSGLSAQKPFYESYDVTPDSVFMTWAEGPAVDTDGVLYAVNYGQKGTIGLVKPDGTHELFVNLPEGSVGNGIRFWKNNTLLVADYTNHNILQINIPEKTISVFAHNDQMNQPNDLAITSEGVIYASDPDWENSTGNLWMIDKDGNFTLLESGMGTTNGVEVSPDEKHLYVNESNQRNVWVYDINEDGTVANKRLLKKFEDYGMDGMRCDIEGNLYVTRMSKGTVAVLSPEGDLIREVVLKGDKPTNVAFGGEDGKTVYVTVADRGAIEAFRTEIPGRSISLMKLWNGVEDR
ncbi:SMP-30/gluconolactonase/LRE family protein [Marinilabilia rubra]|uniref:Gluconolactonase n=1 Tax=Marinilabilia rubra TaxID=2162893 RepID=A0A2U2BAU5_9BACT|nr:SMP-30/gluconolactonase/LRE family protein [Marinilabilia rubra]PWE00163.1 gluconolactonase [Marinilabilia rubra]